MALQREIDVRPSQVVFRALRQSSSNWTQKLTSENERSRHRPASEYPS